MPRRLIAILLILAGAAGAYYMNARRSGGEIFKYTDSEGQAHYVDSLDRVPEAYRSSAKGHNLPNLGKGDYDKYLEAQQSVVNEKSRRK